MLVQAQASMLTLALPMPRALSSSASGGRRGGRRHRACAPFQKLALCPPPAAAAPAAPQAFPVPAAFHMRRRAWRVAPRMHPLFTRCPQLLPRCAIARLPANKHPSPPVWRGAGLAVEALPGLHPSGAGNLRSKLPWGSHSLISTRRLPPSPPPPPWCKVPADGPARSVVFCLGPMQVVYNRWQTSTQQMKANRDLVIVGERVVLVPYREVHVQTYHEWMKSEELRAQTASEPLTLDEEYAMQRSWEEDENSESSGTEQPSGARRWQEQARTVQLHSHAECTFIVLDPDVPDGGGTGRQGGAMAGTALPVTGSADSACASDSHMPAA